MRLVTSGKMVQFRTLRAVEAGEELTIQYTDLYLPRQARQAKLLGSHGFSCACERCVDTQPRGEPWLSICTISLVYRIR
jgi:hypothetical protein